ncbi:MAG: hypothetical protein AB7W37_15050 [Syntrophobacteraceae bacterium]
MNAHPITRVIDKTMICLSLLALFLPLAGCAGGFSNLERGPVPEAGRIAIPSEGAASGSWSMRDLDITYTLQRTAGGIAIYGGATFNSRIRFNFTQIRNFAMSVVYLDGQGNILGAKSILVSAVENPERRMGFSSMAAPPAGAESIAFRYTGEALASDGDDGGGVTGAIFDGPR